MSLLKLIKQYMQANNIEENYTSAIPIEDNSISIELKDVNKVYKTYSEKNSAYIRPTINNISETSFIVVDRDGEEYKHFNKKDYDVKILDLVHPQKSNRYNSFVHIHNDTDVLSMVNSFFTFDTNKELFNLGNKESETLQTMFCI